MTKNNPVRLIPLAAALLGIILIIIWQLSCTFEDLPERVPHIDKSTEKQPQEKFTGSLNGKLEKFDGKPDALKDCWPRFRGKNFDGIYQNDNIDLARTFPADGPKILWEIPLGEGHAGAVIYAGRVYILDYDRTDQKDMLRCLSLTDGKDIWRYSYPVKIKRNHGMSRTVPAVSDKYIVSIGPKCQVLCLDVLTGEFRWALDLVKQYQTKVPLWYAGQCPLIDEHNRAIIAPAGKDIMMMAVDCDTGKTAWTTPNPHHWQMTHSSIIPMECDGKRMYIYCASGGVVGVSADDGKILWETTDWMIRTATVPSPVVIDQHRIFFSGGYNAGSLMLRVFKDKQRYHTETLFKLEPTVFGAEQHTPILFNNHIYGVRQEDEQMVCLDLSGNVIWSSGTTHRFGEGPGSAPYMIANGLIYALNNAGLLRLIEATPTKYHQLAQAQVITDAHDPWGPMALADGRLIIRDLTRMYCLDISAP